MIISTSAALAAAMLSTTDASVTEINTVAVPFAMPRSEESADITTARPGSWGWIVDAFVG